MSRTIYLQQEKLDVNEEGIEQAEVPLSGQSSSENIQENTIHTANGYYRSPEIEIGFDELT